MAKTPSLIFLTRPDRRIDVKFLRLGVAWVVAMTTSNIQSAANEPTQALVDQLVAHSQKHAIQRSTDPKHPLRLAENHAVDLASDVASYNEWMVKIIQGYLINGDITEAEYLVKRLPGYGRSLAHATMALHYAKRQETENASNHLEQALRHMGQASGLTAEQILSDCAKTHYLLNHKAEALGLTNKLSFIGLLAVEAWLHEEGLMAPVSVLDAKRKLVSINEPGVDEHKARFLLACAKQHFKKGDVEQAKLFLAETGEISLQNGLPSAHRVILDMAQVAWAGGEAMTARKAMNLFLKCCQAYGPNAEWKPIYIADAVSVLLDWKELEQAKQWLKIGDESIAGIFVLDAPGAYLKLAQQYGRLKESSEVEARILMALRTAASYKHPRAYPVAAIQVCLYYADANQKLPDTVFNILTQLAAEVAQ